MLLCLIKVYLKSFQHQVVWQGRVKPAGCEAMKNEPGNRLINWFRKTLCAPGTCGAPEGLPGGKQAWRSLSVHLSVRGGSACPVPQAAAKTSLGPARQGGLRRVDPQGWVVLGAQT